jgi:hypothetical protein
MDERCSGYRFLHRSRLSLFRWPRLQSRLRTVTWVVGNTPTMFFFSRFPPRLLKGNWNRQFTHQRPFSYSSSPTLNFNIEILARTTINVISCHTFRTNSQVLRVLFARITVPFAILDLNMLLSEIRSWRYSRRPKMSHARRRQWRFIPITNPNDVISHRHSPRDMVNIHRSTTVPSESTD